MVVIADRLAKLDPSAADPGGLAAQARRRLQQREADLPSAGSTPVPPELAPGLPEWWQYSAPYVDGGTSRGPAVGDDFAHVGLNDPCPCGSGRKFKRCHDDPRMLPDA